MMGQGLKCFTDKNEKKAAEFSSYLLKRMSDSFCGLKLLKETFKMASVSIHEVAISFL